MRQHIRSCLPTSERSNGAGYRHRDGLGGGTARRDNCLLARGHEEEVFVQAAPGFERTDKDGVELLTNLGKCLYGLAYCPCNWWRTIDPLLITLEYVPLRSDTCICIYKKNGIVIILTLYVDDLVVGTDIQVIESIKRQLTERFKMTDMGDVSHVLGMQVTRHHQNKIPTVKPGELHQVYSGHV